MDPVGTEPDFAGLDPDLFENIDDVLLDSPELGIDSAQSLALGPLDPLEDEPGLSKFSDGDDKGACVCRTCGKIFNSVWYLKQHAVKHSAERPFKCKWCDKTYRFRSNLYQHKCPLRQDSAINGTSSEKRRNRLITGSSSSQSGQSAVFAESAAKPLLEIAGSASPHAESSTSGSSTSGLNELSSQQSLATEPGNSSSCAFSSFLPPSRLREYSGTRGRQNAPYSGGKTKRFGEMTRNSNKWCDKALSAANSAGCVSQSEIDQFVEKYKDKLQRCSKCKIYFPSREYLQQHIASHSNDTKTKCLHCSEVFECEAVYASHKTWHAPQSPHVCPNCRGKFVNRLMLKKHMVRCTVAPIVHSNNWTRVIDRSPLATPSSDHAGSYGSPLANGHSPLSVGSAPSTSSTNGSELAANVGPSNRLSSQDRAGKQSRFFSARSSCEFQQATATSYKGDERSGVGVHSICYSGPFSVLPNSERPLASALLLQSLDELEQLSGSDRYKSAIPGDHNVQHVGSTSKLRFSQNSNIEPSVAIRMHTAPASFDQFIAGGFSRGVSDEENVERQLSGRLVEIGVSFERRLRPPCLVGLAADCADQFHADLSTAMVESLVSPPFADNVAGIILENKAARLVGEDSYLTDVAPSSFQAELCDDADDSLQQLADACETLMPFATSTSEASILDPILDTDTSFSTMAELLPANLCIQRPLAIKSDNDGKRALNRSPLEAGQFPTKRPKMTYSVACESYNEYPHSVTLCDRQLLSRPTRPQRLVRVGLEPASINRPKSSPPCLLIPTDEGDRVAGEPSACTRLLPGRPRSVAANHGSPCEWCSCKEECASTISLESKLTTNEDYASQHEMCGYACSECGQKFQSLESLMDHHGLHLPLQPFGCPYCSHACRSQSEITGHRSTCPMQKLFFGGKWCDSSAKHFAFCHKSNLHQIRLSAEVCVRHGCRDRKRRQAFCRYCCK